MKQVEEFYRKWLGVCQQSKVRPLVLNFTGDEVVISVNDTVLLQVHKDEFAKLTANQIVDKLGVMK